MRAPAGLVRRSVGAGGLWIAAVGASSPMTVVAGGLTATFAATGVVGVSLSFVILVVVLWPVTVAYLAAARYVPHAAAAYAVLAHGLGRTWGVVGAAVALLAYNCIQISLYGLLGATLAGLVGGPWWAGALVTWALIGLLGVRHVTANIRVLGAILAAELLMIVAFDIAGLLNPASGTVSWEAFSPDRLLVDGVGGVLALSLAAFVGFETAPIYLEEATSTRTVSRATLTTLLFLGVFYGLAAWAMTLLAGPDGVQAAAAAQQLPFGVLATVYGPMAAHAATTVMIMSVVAALAAFHNVVARYVFAISRESVLPSRWARVSGGRRGGAPVGGSLLQSGVALLVIVVSASVGADPFLGVFSWLATIAAIGVLVLLTGCAAAAGRLLARVGRRESMWTRRTAPWLGVLAGTAVLLVMVTNIHHLLGVAPTSALTLVPPGIVAGTVVVGLFWALLLRQFRPDVFNGIGHGRPRPLAVPDREFARLEL